MVILINGNTIGEHLEYSKLNREARRRNDNDMIVEAGKVEQLINHVKRNKRLYFKLIVLVATLLFRLNPVLALPVQTKAINSMVMVMDVDAFIEKINRIGGLFRKLFNIIAYWCVLLLTYIRSTETAMLGDPKKVINIAIQGVTIMAIFHFLPEIFDLIEAIALD